MSVKINSLEIENVKRVQAVKMDCTEKQLTVIGGGNGQGKSSVLDAIMWTLGGDRMKPSKAVRDGADRVATRIELNNGVLVERTGKNGTLKVTDQTGKKGGQQLLNDFVNQLALNLPKFMAASNKDKADMLLEQYPDIGAKLQQIMEAIKDKYDQRHGIGQMQKRKEKHAEDLPFHADAPDEPVTAKELTDRLQRAMAVNAKNEQRRLAVEEIRTEKQNAEKDALRKQEQIDELEKLLAERREELEQIQAKVKSHSDALTSAVVETKSLEDQDTSEIEAELERVDQVNAKVRENQTKRQAEEDAEALHEEYRGMTAEIEGLRDERNALLKNLSLPLDGLSIDDDGDLVMNGAKWDCMSGSEQLRVAAAVCSALKPECGFVLLDGLESMDLQTLHDFGEWVAERDLQVIGTRVSDGDECSIIIEDGKAVERVVKEEKENWDFD
ncbi:MAG: chromosome segregation protein SMC [Spartobacteria bacterium]|nr:chromosome segregation protein SMC [Spartobacteria bacterium]